MQLVWIEFKMAGGRYEWRGRGQKGEVELTIMPYYYTYIYIYTYIYTYTVLVFTARNVSFRDIHVATDI